MSVEFIDNSKEVKSAMHTALIRGLEIIGQTAEKYAKQLCPTRTSTLKNSITHRVNAEEYAVYIGSDVEYAAYVELGTGEFYEGGTPRPWGYKDEKGNQHWTGGNRAQPYLKPAAADHRDQYREILENEMKNG